MKGTLAYLREFGLYAWMLRGVKTDAQEGPVHHPANNKSSLRWMLDEQCRDELLAVFLPHYPIVRARYGELGRQQWQGSEKLAGAIVGQVDKLVGFQALIVSIAGFTEGVEGYVFHIVWSLSTKSLPMESAKLCASWEPTPVSIPVHFNAQHSLHATGNKQGGQQE